MALLSRASGGIADVVRVRHPAACRQYMCCELFDGQAAPTAQIEDRPMSGRGAEGLMPGIDDVADVDEIARLLPVPEDGQGLPPQEIAQEDAQHPLVGVVESLAGAIDVVHAKGRHVEWKPKIDA